MATVLIDEHQAALLAIDRLARQAISRVAPIRLGVAQTEAERQAAYRLRYEAVISRGWMTPQEMPDEIEYDRYDDQAVHIVGYDGEMLATTARIIFPRPGQVLPTEAAFGIRIEPRGKVVDAGRFVVARNYSGIEHRMLSVLLAQTWLIVRQQGYARVCAAFASKAMIRVYRQMGFQVTLLGEERFYWGEMRFPVLFDVAQSSQTLVQHWSSDVESSG
jgi:N-acyl-L-homoserine lactone synthetase